MGIPSVFVLATGIGVLAGTGLGVAAMIGGWSGLFGGTYMGGLFFIHPSKRRLAKAAGSRLHQAMNKNTMPSTIKAMP